MADIDELIAELGGGSSGQAQADPIDSVLDDIETSRKGSTGHSLIRSGLPTIARKGGTSAVDAAGEGFMSGALAGWKDELSGFAQKFDIANRAGSSGGAQASETAGKAATKQTRQRDEELREAHPVAFTGGELTGAMTSAAIPLGTASKATQVGRAAAEGAVAGAGYSDADSVTGRLLGAGAGAALGGGVAAAIPATIGAVSRGVKSARNKVVEKLRSGAEKRMERRAVTELTAGATEGQKKAVLADKDAFLKEAKDLGGASDPAKLVAAAKAGKEAVEKEAAELRGTIQTRIGPVEAENVVGALKAVRERAAQNPMLASKVKKLDGMIADVESRFAKAKPPEPLGDQEILQLIANKAPASVKQKLGAKPDAVIAQVKKFGLDKAADEGAEQFATKTQEAVQTVGKRIGEITDELQLFSEGVPVRDFSKRLLSLHKEMAKNPAKKAEAAAVWGLMKDVAGSWDVKGTVPIRQFRQFVTELQGGAFGGNVMVPTAQKALKKEIAGVAKSFLDKHMDDLTTQKWTGKNGQKLKGLIDELRDNNATFSVLKDVEKAALKRQAAARINPEPAKVAAPSGPGVVTQSQLDEMVEALPEADMARAPLKEMADQRFAAAAGDDAAKLTALEKSAERRGVLADIGEKQGTSALGDERRPASVGGIVGKLTGGLGPGAIASLVDPTLGAGVFLNGLAKKYGPKAIEKIDDKLIRLKTLADKGVKPDTLFGIAARLGISKQIAADTIGTSNSAAPIGAVATAE